MGEDEAMEKLVEEIVWLMHECFGEAEKVPSHDYFAVLHDYAEKATALTLKAVVDGRLKIPGEYYRGDGVNIEQIEATRALFRRRSAEDQKDLMGYEDALDDLLDVAHSIIAFLSPTEEEK